MARKAPSGGNQPNSVSSVLDYSRRFLLYGFLISIGLHFLLGPLIQFKRYTEEGEKVEKVSVTKKVTKVATPKPTPTPTPPPSPTPTPHVQTPPPQTPPPKVVRLKVDVPKTESKSESGPTETQYDVKSGSQQGVPGGQATGAPASAVAAAPPTPAPTPTPTPRPQCANPNMTAAATDKVTPDMPEIARQMGATGTAQVKVSLDAAGKVTSVSIYKSTNNRALDAAALDAAKQSRYRAEVKDCVAVAGSYLYTVTFENQ